MADAKRRLQKSQELWQAKNFGEAYHEAQRALRPVRILMRAHWEKAVRGMDTPVASPFAISFYTLPRHWQFMAQLQQFATVGPNILPGGDFEADPEHRQEAWKETRQTLDDVDLVSDRVTELKVKREEPKKDENDKAKDKNAKDQKDAKDTKDTKDAKTAANKGPELPMEGRQCAMLQIKPRPGMAVPAALERSLVALESPPVKLPPGTLVQISGWVNIPAPIAAAPDGAILYDSVGGEALAIRLTAPTPWKKFTVYRRVPASGFVNVTLALTGIGTVYFDDIRIETRLPSSSIAAQAVGGR